MYQGGSDSFLGPREPIPLADPAWGCDFEAEIAAIVDDVDALWPARGRCLFRTLAAEE